MNRNNITERLFPYPLVRTIHRPPYLDLTPKYRGSMVFAQKMEAFLRKAITTTLTLHRKTKTNGK